ncbi:MAG TPA: hypothetical protein VE439_03055 [Anaerolineae bacterium]|jgi:cytoskeletal protein CcmA (bactofilin family)|nr:hypothetical protein [Anaerolineae bacterium]
MKRIFLAIAFIAIFLLCQPAQAATLRSSNNVNIASDTVVNDDLYVSGGTVTMNGRINGDLIVAGGNVTVNGPVRDDLTVAGGTVTLNGSVSQSVRTAGGTLSISGNIGQDLVIAGGTINVGTDSVIGRDVILTSGDARLSGQIGRRLHGSAGSIVIDGRIGDNVRINVDQLTLTDRAVVNGDLVYTSRNRANIAGGARVTGETERREPRFTVTRPTAGLRVLSFILSFLAAFLFGVVLLLLLPVRTIQTADTISSSPWISLLLGLAVLIILPIAAIVVLVFVITIPLSLTALFLYALGIYLSQVFVGLTLGRFLTGYFKLSTGNVVALLIGLLIITLFGLIPIVGAILRFLYILFGLGAIALVTYRVIRERPSPQL